MMELGHIGTSEPRIKISYLLKLCMSGARVVFGEKVEICSFYTLNLYKVAPRTSRKDRILRLKMYLFGPRNDCLLHECHSICQVFKTKHIYIYMYKWKSKLWTAVSRFGTCLLHSIYIYIYLLIYVFIDLSFSMV